MPHETVIHRIDAELGTGRAVAPVPSDLAVDGIDELLNIFVAYTITEGSDYFTDILGRSPGWTYLVRADGSAWQMRTGPELFTVADGAGDEAADVTVSGPPAAVLRWVRNREDPDGRSEAAVEGGQEAVDELRRCIVLATQ
jgi:hypothetical protein